MNRVTAEKREIRPRNSGFSLLSLLLVLVIVGLGYYVYLRIPDDAGVPTDRIEQAQTASQEIACRMNRQATQRSMLTWSVTHPNQAVSLDALRRDGVHIAGCPDRGQWSVQGSSIECSLHGSQ